VAAEYYEFEDADDLPDCRALSIDRARQLCESISRLTDYSLVRLLARRQGPAVTTEILIVDVECHGVPPQNVHGLRFRERLALWVPADPAQLATVLALRRDFPTLIHQNQAATGTPASLCLYFEPPASVLRTWTPQKFLRRIQWWLEQSAKDGLHAADQPVEQLFFSSPYELVLPWHFGASTQRGRRFVIRRGMARPDQGETYFVVPVDDAGTQGERLAVPIELQLPPVVQGQI
jgi:hypothetical protein